MSRYKLVIFDFDGTLADTFPWFSSTINVAARRFRFRQVSSHELEELRAMDTKSIMRSLEVSWWKVPWIARFMRKQMSAQVKQIKLFPGVEAMLEQLAENQVKIAIVSSNSLENVQNILPGECARYISYYACGASLFKKKAKFQKVISHTQTPLFEVLCIGDEGRDLEAARATGVDFGAVIWGYAEGEILRALGAKYVFQKIEEIAPTIVE